MNIKILSHPCEVEVVAFDGNESDRYGDCDMGAMKIRLSADLSGSRSAEVLWHEILHLLLFLLGVDNCLKHNTEEIVVQALAAGVCQVLRDNPGLFELEATAK